MSQARSSILFAGPPSRLDDRLVNAFNGSFGRTVTRETASFATMNGRASQVAKGHDVVVFAADPDNPDEFTALSDMMQSRREGAIFVALTDESLPLAKARRLYDLGIDEVLPNSIDTDQLKKVVDTRLEQLRKGTDVITSAKQGEVICVAQARGGIGATTFAVNLALSLVGKSGGLIKREPAARVALIDLDIQFGNAGILLDIEDNGGFRQLVESVEPPDAHFLKGIMIRHESGLEVLTAPVTMTPLHAVTTAQVRELFDLLRREYDYIVVDLPHALVEWLEPVMERASRLMVISDTSVPCVRQARRLMDFYKEVNIGLPIDIVVNRESKPLFRSQTQKEAERVLETEFVHWIPDNPKIARRAIDLGQPVVLSNGGSDIGKAFKKVAASLKAAGNDGTARASAPAAKPKFA